MYQVCTLILMQGRGSIPCSSFSESQNEMRAECSCRVIILMVLHQPVCHRNELLQVRFLDVTRVDTKLFHASSLKTFVTITDGLTSLVKTLTAYALKPFKLVAGWLARFRKAPNARPQNPTFGGGTKTPFGGTSKQDHLQKYCAITVKRP